jgi:hypothetical protein
MSDWLPLVEKNNKKYLERGLNVNSWMDSFDKC